MSIAFRTTVGQNLQTQEAPCIWHWAMNYTEELSLLLFGQSKGTNHYLPP